MLSDNDWSVAAGGGNLSAGTGGAGKPDGHGAAADADLTHNPEELLYGSLRSRDLTLFSFLIHAGVRIPAKQENIYRLFLHLENRRDPDILPILDRLGMDLKQYGGEALRSMASQGNQMLAEYLHSERERTGKADRLITSLPDLTRRQGQILRYMLEYKDEEFGIREIADRFSVAYQTARTDLMHLEACKYLWMRKRGKAQYYIVDEEWVASVQGLIG